MCTLLPGLNLVTNKGFCQEATYTSYEGSRFANLETHRNTIGTWGPVVDDAAFDRRYHQNTAALLREIITQRGELNLLEPVAD